MKNKLVLTGFIVAVFLLVMVVGVAQANPLPSPMVIVHSPKNNEIYPSRTVQLNFTPIYVDDKNFTSFTYVLDGQSPVATNGTATLSNLSPGQHTLTIYCSYNYFSRTFEFLNRTYEYKDEVANVVYFTTEYSVPWITFTIIAVATVTIIPSLLFLKRRQITTRLKGKKTGVFWLGTFLFILGSLAFIPFAWKVIADSLFPYWPKGLDVSPSFYFSFIGALIFTVGVGLFMMWIGTRDGKNLDEANDERKYLFG
jgi:hypothetical protein